MNKLGIFMNFWENNWTADTEKYIKKAAGIGFDILEFQAQALLDMSDNKLSELKNCAKDFGIELTYSLGLDPAYDISNNDPSVRKKGIEYLKRIMQQIYKMNGTMLSGVSYAGWGSPNYIVNDKSALLYNSVESMRELVMEAENAGILYCVEAVNRFEGCIINTAQEALDYVNLVDSNNIGILLDTFHMNIEETSIGDAIRLAGEKLRGFHTGENNRTPPGRGHLDWDEIFGALNEIHYTGPIVSEPFVVMGGEVGRDIKVWRNLIDCTSESALDKEAEFLLRFTKDKIKNNSIVIDICL